MKFDPVSFEDIRPFDAKIMAGDKLLGTINGTFDRNALVSGFFLQIADMKESDPRFIVALVAVTERMLRSWDLTDYEGEPCDFCRLWDMPPGVVAQIISGMFAAANGEPPSYLKGLI